MEGRTISPSPDMTTGTEPRKRIKTSSYHRPCLDWMVVSGNCHYARDRSSFCTYRPVLGAKQYIRNNVFDPDEELQVAGVGTVELRVVPRRQRFGEDHTLLATTGGILHNNNNNSIGSTSRSSTHVIVLEDVLHIPEALCNGFNPLLLGNCSMSCHADYWEGADHKGNPLWYSTPFAGGTRLVLAEDPQDGESELIPGRCYTLSLYVSLEEKEALLSRVAGSGRGIEEDAMEFDS